MLTKLSIRNYRIFKDFSWANSLHPFSKKNLIYGWNGTGKSTLTDIFRAIEKRHALNGNITLSFGQRNVLGGALPSEGGLPQVKVFNRAYVEENIFTPENRATSIFYLGEESIEKQKEIETHRACIGEIDKKYVAGKLEKTKQEKEFEKFCQEKANDTIKPILRSSGSNNSYNTYNKGHFKIKADFLGKLSPTELQQKILSDNEYQIQIKKITATSKDDIPLLPTLLFDTEALKKLINSLFFETVSSQVLEELENNANLSNWVKTGLDLHKTANGFHAKCAFCGNELKENRAKEIENHFNDAYNSFIAKIDKNIKAIDQKMVTLKTFNFPEKTNFYDSQVLKYEQARGFQVEQIKLAIELLESVKDELEEKKKSPFRRYESQTVFPEKLDVSTTKINEIISDNNSLSTNLHDAIKHARSTIEEHIVAKSLMDYDAKKNALILLDQEMSDLLKTKTELTAKVTELERSVREDLKPAEELNNDIQSYLGRNELKFTVKENGYELTRGSVVAENLSEGEKTAIAFLHFLKSLCDRDFNIENGLVVIDDPISSLDSNSIYHAFGFMKDKTDKAGQLFILTHNHTFFRQVKNWFNHLPKQNSNNIEKRPARFYMILSKIIGNDRQSVLAPLDSLLHEYESEYHYLFSMVFNASQIEIPHLKNAYPLPNISRRLIETFLAFKNPNGKSLQAKFDEVHFDTGKKNRILRFLHTYSHFDQIPEPDHDPSILQESQAIMSDVLAFIKAVDESHYNSMVTVLNNNQIDENEN